MFGLDHVGAKDPHKGEALCHSIAEHFFKIIDYRVGRDQKETLDQMDCQNLLNLLERRDLLVLLDQVGYFITNQIFNPHSFS